MRDRFAHPAWLLALAPVVWLALWHDLGAPALHTSDEACHTDVARNMLLRDSFTDLWYYERPYAGKPPLKIWVTALLLRAVGQDEWVVRLPDATCATLTTLLVWLLARRLFGGPATLVAPVLFVLAPYPLVVHGWREGVQDSPLTLLLAASFVMFLWGADRPSGPRAGWWLGAGVAAGLATLVKSAVGFLAFGPIGLWLLARRQLRRLLDPRLLLAFVAAFVLWLSWHHDFLAAEVEYNLYNRVAEWHTEPHPASMYWTWLSEGFHPWGYALPLAFLLVVARTLTGSAGDLWVLCWIGGVGVPWLFPHLKHPWYIYPAYPAVALALARLLVPPELWREPRGGGVRLVGRMLGAAVAIAGVAFGIHQSWSVVRHPERVPMQELSHALRNEAPSAPRLAIWLAPGHVCPDERYYFDLALPARRGYVSSMAEVLGLAVEEPRLVVILPEPLMDDLIRGLLPIRQDLSVAYSWPRCRWSYGVRLPERVILAMGPPPSGPRFEPFPRIKYGEGFGVVEYNDQGAFSWCGDRATLRLIQGCGTVRLRLLSFFEARPVRIDLPDRAAVVDVPAEGTEVAFHVDVPDGGELVLEPLAPCTRPADVLPGELDRRCLSISVAHIRFEQDEAPAGE